MPSPSYRSAKRKRIESLLMMSKWLCLTPPVVAHGKVKREFGGKMREGEEESIRQHHWVRPQGTPLGAHRVVRSFVDRGAQSIFEFLGLLKRAEPIPFRYKKWPSLFPFYPNHLHTQASSPSFPIPNLLRNIYTRK